MSGVIIPAKEGGKRLTRLPLQVKCAACRERIRELALLADPAHLEEHPAFVLCEPCYIHIRSGYQRDRDRRARETYAAGQAAFGRTNG